jgi:hypothetical protein
MNPEQVLAAAVVSWLADGGWEVYQEVETPNGRCDIVAVRGPIRWAIEVKTSLNLAVMDQAFRNAAWFHHSSIAVPAPANNQFASPRNWQLAHDIGKLLGFGVLRIVCFKGGEAPRVIQDTLPVLNRRPGTIHLHEEQKNWCAAGSNHGGHFTRFQSTAQRLTSFVKRTPGMSLKEAVKSIDHHYASVPSATGALSKLIRQGVIEGVRLDNGFLFPVAS